MVKEVHAEVFNYTDNVLFVKLVDGYMGLLYYNIFLYGSCSISKCIFSVFNLDTSVCISLTTNINNHYHTITIVSRELFPTKHTP